MLNIPVAAALLVLNFKSVFNAPMAIHIKNALVVVGELTLFITTCISHALEVCMAHMPTVQSKSEQLQISIGSGLTWERFLSPPLLFSESLHCENMC